MSATVHFSGNSQVMSSAGPGATRNFSAREAILAALVRLLCGGCDCTNEWRYTNELTTRCVLGEGWRVPVASGEGKFSLARVLWR